MILPIRLRKVALFAVDISLMYVALVLAIVVRKVSWDAVSDLSNHLGPFTVIFLVWSGVLYFTGQYELKEAEGFIQTSRQSVRSFLIAGALAVGLFYVVPAWSIAPKTILLLFGAIFYVEFVLWRRVFFRLVIRQGRRIRVAVAGWDPAIYELLPSAVAHQGSGFVLTLVYCEGLQELPHLPGVRVTDSLADLEELIDNRGVEVLVTAIDPHISEKLQASLFIRISRAITIVSLPSFYESANSRVPINSINQMWFLEHLDLRSKLGYERVKRVADVALSTLLLVLSAPLWPVLSLVIILDSPGSPIFRQTRSGLGMKPFTIYKFRTMTSKGNTFKMTEVDDVRITGVGKFLRKSRLDEIPQLWNILVGQMSFVGPRPERPELIEDLQKFVPFYRERMLVVPGLTGWDQVSGEYHSASMEDTLKKLQYDLYYVKNRSLSLDLRILFKTLGTVLSRGGR